MLIKQPFTLPCGVTLPNRLCKAAMTEGVADDHLHATARHATLYKRWSDGGAGLLLTGNVQIDRRVLERPGNVAIDPAPASGDAEGMAQLKAWAAAGTANGNQLWMQISHAGRQSPRYVTSEPMAPSPVQLKLLGNYGAPRALTEGEILDFIERFARVARVAKAAGFTGVQIHSAHGYLLSSFLSPITNQRTDQWGGSLENRARFLLLAIRATRQAVGAEYPIAVKLNSDDFRKGGFSHEDCLAVVQMLNAEGIDLLEISGGTYEQPKLLGHTGSNDTAVPQRESTQQREAYFLDYARAIRQVATMPLMVTGGFRSTEVMEAALADGVCDVIGLGRPLCSHPDTPKDLLSGRISRAVTFEHELKLADSGIFSPTSSVLPLKLLNVLGGQAWYYQQIFHLADGKTPDTEMGILKAFAAYYWDEITTARRVKKAAQRR
ncbi:2,4-dienoyl-CoA reductase-like NADH-dependent reductase (Old Yellow Enzyme family) [Paraperlucidibaca baekdonensis]|uniref:2,4-dienoyl-CoA reductase-like NADH-dependent reductase (Old Yellow Enzyme family) n=1 Tax=Paraperlucidibaca baekdonensis TaxID=748120 RepID=A0A3E0H3F5_9GAMM|nr:NADH:flavin oxidoreductase/NADH oxidase family protein [Paraperlucidibaca baekdonensis]REH37837.1 2,4-dienoyl-CoA reductase-like NADH-dependent reductase (Old Yellow Enzyme family) [Paraperlucidibaca baekdonensis]